MRQLASNPLTYILLWSFFLFTWGVGWGLPNTEEWIADSLAPFHPLLGLSKIFSFGYFNKYPLVHQVILAVFNIPVVIAAFINSKPLEGLQVMKFLLLIKSTPYATAFIVIDRMVSVFMGVGVVYLSYRSAKELFSERTGLFTAAIVSLNGILNFHSHAAKVDTPYLFWAMAALFFLIRVIKYDEKRDYITLAIMIALSYGTKDQAYAIFILHLIIYLVIDPLLRRDRSVSIGTVLFRKNMKVFTAVFIISFIVVENLILNLPGFAMRLAFLLGEGRLRSVSYSSDLDGVLQLFIDTVHGMTILGTGMPLMIACSAGIVVMFFKYSGNRRELLARSLFLIAALSYYLFFIQLARQSVYRFHLPLSVFLSIYGGYLLDTALWKVKRPYRPLFFAGVVLLCLHSLYITLSVNVNLARDVRYRVEDWMSRAVPAGSVIEYYAYLHYLPRFPEGTKSYRVKERFETLQERKPDYIVLSSSYYYRYIFPADLSLIKGLQIPKQFLKMKAKNESYFKGLIESKTEYKPVRVFYNRISFFMDLGYLRVTPAHIIVLKRIAPGDRTRYLAGLTVEKLFGFDKIDKEMIATMMKRGRTVFYGIMIFFGALGLLLVALWIYNVRQSKRWLAIPEPPGRLVDAGSGRIYARVAGAGYATVIIIPELGHPSFLWWPIQEELAKTARVLTYDRGGYGWSDPGRFPRTGAAVVNELTSLLDELKINGPYLVVGDGIGALYARQFAQARRADIKGVLLINPMTVDDERIKKSISPVIYNNLLDKRAGLGVSSIFGSLGIVRSLGIVPYPSPSKRVVALSREHFSRKNAYDAMRDEYSAGTLGETARQILAEGPFPPVPLVVLAPSAETTRNTLYSYGISYDEAQSLIDVKQELCKETAALSPRGSVVEARRAMENFYLEEHDTIARLVRSLLEQK